jgi:hypothetical protein
MIRIQNPEVDPALPWHLSQRLLILKVGMTYSKICYNLAWIYQSII